MRKKVQDLFIEKQYESESALYKAYGIPEKTGYDREAKGLSKEKILTTPVKVQIKTKEDDSVDPFTGKQYESKYALYRAYGILPETGQSRKRRGWSKEKILTTPVRARNKEDDSVDPFTGKQYESKYALYKAYGIPPETGQSRKHKGWSKEKILTTPVRAPRTKTKTKEDDSVDPFTGKQYESESALYKAYGILPENGHSRKRKGWSKEKILEITPHIQKSFCGKYKPIQKYNLTISKRIYKGEDVFECYIDNEDGTQTFRIMTYDMIEHYCIEQYKKLHNIQ